MSCSSSIYISGAGASIDERMTLQLHGDGDADDQAVHGVQLGTGEARRVVDARQTHPHHLYARPPVYRRASSAAR